jgi:hypothetical protein
VVVRISGVHEKVGQEGQSIRELIFQAHVRDLLPPGLRCQATSPPPQVPERPVDADPMIRTGDLMARALVAVLLMAIPFVTSVVLGRRAGHPDVGT